MIIDAHTHIEGLPGCSWLDPPEMIIRLLDEAGIDQAAVMTYVDAPLAHPTYDPLEYVRQAIVAWPDRLIGFARIDPGADEAADLLTRAIRDWGFRALKLHPAGYRMPPDSPPTVALIRHAATLGVPVLFHCGDEDHTYPLDIERVARLCPEATIILGHMGGYFHVRDAIEVAVRNRNIILETSAMPYPRRIKEACETIGPERIMFGSDGPGCDPRLELHKVRLAGLSDAELSLVLVDNFRRLTGLGES